MATTGRVGRDGAGFRVGGAPTRALALYIALVASGAARAGPFPVDGVEAQDAPDWATRVVEIVRGPQDASDPQSPPANFGLPEDALGIAEAQSTGVVSLGEGGSITLGFAAGVGNGPGPDLAVYENAFPSLGGLFSELGFVEVSSDGGMFARFASTSLTPEPIGAFGVLDPTDSNGLAGRLPASVGVPFDLSDLSGAPEVVSGQVDLDAIAYVRVVDVIGDGSVADSSGHPIYDPWPTAFDASGIDVDGVAILHPLRPVPLAPPQPLAVALAVLIAAARLIGRSSC